MPKKTRKKTTKRGIRRKTLPKDKKTEGQDALTLALYLISFILIVFGAWYHRLSWLLFGFIPFLVAVWYEYMKHHI
jgi:4-hydroxybenzoate polyprenyltransferase